MENPQKWTTARVTGVTKLEQENIHLHRTWSPAVILKKERQCCNFSQPNDSNLSSFLTHRSSVVWDAFLWVPSHHQTTAKMWSFSPASFPASEKKGFWKKRFVWKAHSIQTDMNIFLKRFSDNRRCPTGLWIQRTKCPHPSSVYDLTKCAAGLFICCVCDKKKKAERGDCVYTCSLYAGRWSGWNLMFP